MTYTTLTINYVKKNTIKIKFAKKIEIFFRKISMKKKNKMVNRKHF